MQQVVISGTGLFTPDQSISNSELVASFNAYAANWNAAHAAAIAAGALAPMQESSEAFIEKASGIRSRFVIDKRGVLDPARMCPDIPERPDDQPSLQCEMAVHAAREALAQAGRTAADIDAVIVACSNLQRPYPAVSVEVQAALGIGGFAFDMNVACSSATFGIDMARNAVLTGSARAVLVISPEICSGHLEFRDRDCHFIFGDACTAVVVEREAATGARAPFRIIDSRLKTTFSNNIRNNFGFLNRAAPGGIGARDKLFRQDGRKVFKEVCPMVAEIIVRQLGDLGIPLAALRRLWLHQANLGMNQLIGRRVLGREPLPEETPVILDTYANTSSAGSIIAFHQFRDDLARGERGVICSFGAGYSVGSLVVERCD
ncbi:MAG: beta-ketoacyl-ACP synthase III [Pseudomonadales bacterium]|jgi:beta-ketodecanoyl-[acyl-carrier-protein] synthase|nr:beta-ketoacyl-ACP synthase III [Gammaproteobacteria bacterium]MBP6481993.1 beta-ketoacyl-ACP synthase III [Pseudomonadales bacterium]MBP7909825.1 beta-ketoacyl-ACP synthase III [Pseudomonadales bacterium]